MSIAWLVYLLLVGVLLAAAAALVASATSGIGRPTRWVWAGALAGCAALAIVAPQRRPLQMRVVQPALVETSLVAPRPSKLGLGGRISAEVREAVGAASDAVAALERRVPRAVTRSVLVGWAAASALLLSIFAIINLRLVRARRGWPTERVHGLAIRVAPATGPAVLGLLRPEIVVPRSLLERGAEEQRLILAHEREHLRARDHLLLAAGCLVAIALPWHPAIWYLLGRLRLAIELDCDARVLRGGVTARSYGALLIDVAANHGGIRIGALALADGPSHLERRILAMNGTRRRHAVAYGAVLTAFGTLLVLVACEAKIPTSAEIAQMDVAAAERSASEAGFMRTPQNDKTDFFVNGVKVSAEQARLLEAKIIGSIEVVKSEFASGRDTIFITTADRMPKAPPMVDKVERARSGGSEYSVRKVMFDSSKHTVANVERQGERMRTRSSESSARQPLLRKSRGTGSDDAPIITIDGKIASEAELAALDEREIASLAIYKGKEALLNMLANKKQHLEVTSAPAAMTGMKNADALIAVTTKMAARSPSKRP